MSSCPLGPKVFTTATVDTAVVIASKGDPESGAAIAIVAPRDPREIHNQQPYHISQSRFWSNEGCVFDYRLSEAGAAIVFRLMRGFPVIENGFEFGVGINTGYIRDEIVGPTRKGPKYHPMVPGTGISRYGSVQTDGWTMYDPEYVKSRGDRGRSLPAETLFKSDKILVVRTRNLSLPRRIVATIDSDQKYNLNRLSNIVARKGFSLAGLLGILNSTLFQLAILDTFLRLRDQACILEKCPYGRCERFKA